ncbi:hypothetical protein D0Z03_002400 [Geotrichum reessii]|nr:hypothetical protein D0Z03_002400 [Galactomyces reessii]
MAKPQQLILILAATPKLGIGYAGTLPWHLPTELKYFRAVTQNQTVIMGRATWESIPPKFRPLPRRDNLVVSRSLAASEQDLVHPTTGHRTLFHESLSAALAAAAAAGSSPSKRIYIIGGAQLYNSVLELATSPAGEEFDVHVLLTEVARADGADTPCDTFFTGFLPEQWQKQSHADLVRFLDNEAVNVPRGKIAENDYEFEFTYWTKRDSN